VFDFHQGGDGGDGGGIFLILMIEVFFLKLGSLSVLTLSITTSIPNPSSRLERILFNCLVKELADLGKNLELLSILFLVLSMQIENFHTVSILQIDLPSHHCNPLTFKKHVNTCGPSGIRTHDLSNANAVSYRTRRSAHDFDADLHINIFSLIMFLGSDSRNYKVQN
jgi:hypothetical protein